MHWLTTDPDVSIVEYGPTPGLGSRVADLTPVTDHRVSLSGLLPRTKYHYVVKERSTGQELSSEVFEFETDFNYAVPPAPELPSPYSEDALTAVYARVAQGILDRTGRTRGYCLDYGCGDGRLAYELARRSELNVMGVAEDSAAIQRGRQALQAAGLYGSRVTLHAGPLAPLPYAKDSFNLIVSADLLTAQDAPGSAAELYRVLRPGGGVAWLGYPPEVAGDLSNWAALEAWAQRGIAPDQAAMQTDPGRAMVITRAPLPGGGSWTHGYADPGNTACSQDERIVGAGMRLQWFGLPGPRGMIDRGCRVPQPLAVNGVLFTEGLNRVTAQDAYNGRIYWSLEIPKLIRVNIPRDTSNLCADETSLYLAVRDRCWRLEAESGQLRQHYPLASPNPFLTYDWGYLATVGDHLYGSSVKRGASYTEYSGPAHWYDSLGTASTAKVCSDNLFCRSKTSGETCWTYAQGVIVNSAIAMGDGRVYFVESRHAVAKAQRTGRIAVAHLWQDLYLVALDAATGVLAWERPLAVSVAPYPAVFFLCYSRGKLLLMSSTSRFYLYAFAADDGSVLWQKNHAWLRDNHGGHMYHPVLVGPTVYLEPYAYDLVTGNVVQSGLPARAGCSTLSAAANMIHGVQLNYDNAALCFWDLATNQRRQMVGSRASCWMSVISAGGLVLSPTASAGCTCRYPLQTSIGFAAP